MNNREISGEYRPDLIHLLNEAKKGFLLNLIVLKCNKLKNYFNYFRDFET